MVQVGEVTRLDLTAAGQEVWRRLNTPGSSGAKTEPDRDRFLFLSHDTTAPKQGKTMKRALRYFAAAVARKEAEEEEVGGLQSHLVPHMARLDLNPYLPGSGYKYSNRHSESVLAIMLGEAGRAGNAVLQAEGGKGSESEPGTQEGGPVPPQLSQEDYAMAAFWADLGVAPPSSAPCPAPLTPNKRLSQGYLSDEDDFEM